MKDLSEDGAFSVTKYGAGDDSGEDITADTTVYYSTSNDLSNEDYEKVFLTNDSFGADGWKDAWTTAYPLERANAVAFSFGDTQLAKDEYVVIEFETEVQEFNNADEKEEAALNYAQNKFSFCYTGVAGGTDSRSQMFTSNHVNAILMPAKVKVGGKI